MAVEDGVDARAALTGERREIGALVESMKAEVVRAQAREEQAAARIVQLHERGTLPPDALAAVEEHAAALERRAGMSVELASLEAKHAVLGRLDAALAAPAPRAAAEPQRMEEPDVPLDEAKLLRAVIATQEEERRRIARAVHDGPAQAMANVVLQSEISERVFQADPASSRTELAALRAMVNKTLQELRGFIFELRPMILDDLGLVPTLRRYVQTLSEKHGVKVDLSSTGRDRRLPADDEVAVFRLVQDALLERAQHAGAKQVALGLDWRDDLLEIALQSDGGTAAQSGELSSGLTRAERLGLLGGSVHESRADGRVSLTFRLPIAAAPQLSP